jgi:hypothetical protein
MHERNHHQKTRRFAATPLAIVAAILFVAAPGPRAEALESDACHIEILVDGTPLTEYPARGTTYVEALRGREYGVRLTNRTDHRIAVALAVDGLNSIDAKTTSARQASKWVLDPHQTITINGWQTSSTDARRFFFTTEERSYGAWLDKVDNLGVIEAVVFRERDREMTIGGLLEKRSSRAPAPSVRARPPASAEQESGKSTDADDLAATGIGRRIDHRVRRVHLELEEQPVAHLRLRYEYRQQLVHLGILPSSEEQEALARRDRARGFSDFEFSPDPFNPGR